MTNTALGNTGRNEKPMQHDFTELKNTIEDIDTRLRYRNSGEVLNAIKLCAYEIYPMKTYNIGEIESGLVKAKFLKDKNKHYNNINAQFVYEIPINTLKYYQGELSHIDGMDVDNDEVSEEIGKVIKKDIDTNNKAIFNYITEAQDYLVDQGILRSEEPSTAIATEGVSDTKNIKSVIRKEPEHTLTTIDKIHVTPAGVPGDVTDAVDTGVTNTAIDTSADVANIVQTKLSKYMSMLRVGQYKIPIAILSTVLGIGTIGGAYYATGSTDALDTIGSDTDTEVLNDTNDTAQRHGVCIATITACTVLLALCTTAAYWIRKKKQQHDTAYTTMHYDAVNYYEDIADKYKLEILIYTIIIT